MPRLTRYVALIVLVQLVLDMYLHLFDEYPFITFRSQALAAVTISQSVVLLTWAILSGSPLALRIGVTVPLVALWVSPDLGRGDEWKVAMISITTGFLWTLRLCGLRLCYEQPIAGGRRGQLSISQLIEFTTWSGLLLALARFLGPFDFWARIQFALAGVLAFVGLSAFAIGLRPFSRFARTELIGLFVLLLVTYFGTRLLNFEFLWANLIIIGNCFLIGRGLLLAGCMLCWSSQPRAQEQTAAAA